MKLICVSPQGDNFLTYLKPDTSLLRNNDDFYLPDFSDEIRGELALIVRIKKIGKNISERFAPRYYEDIALGINFVAADRLAEKKANGLPWEEAVCFDYSLAISTYVAKGEQEILQLRSGENLVQELDSSEINIDQIISHCSHLFTLKIGDLLVICPSNETFKTEADQGYHGSINNESSFECHIK